MRARTDGIAKGAVREHVSEFRIFFSFPTRVLVCLLDTDLLCYLHLFRKTNHVDFDHAIVRDTSCSFIEI